MTKITENNIEQFAIELLEKQAYQRVDNSQHNSLADVLLLDTLQAAISRINPSIPVAARERLNTIIYRLGDLRKCGIHFYLS